MHIIEAVVKGIQKIVVHFSSETMLPDKNVEVEIMLIYS